MQHWGWSTGAGALGLQLLSVSRVAWSDTRSEARPCVSAETHLVVIGVCHIEQMPLLVPGNSEWMLKLRTDAYSINITKSK